MENNYDVNQVVYQAGRRLCGLRNRSGLQQTELGALCGLNQNTVSKVEVAGYRNYAYLDAVLRLTQYFKVDPAWTLFGYHLPVTRTSQAVAHAFEHAQPEVQQAVLTLLSIAKTV
jgi:transcriptional regulator with XRE-family HTH domain